MTPATSPATTSARAEHPAGSFPPGPPPRKRGLVSSLRYNYGFFRDSLGFVNKRFETYGDLYYAPSDGLGLYVVRHPLQVHEVLVANAAKYGKGHTALQRVADIIGDGMLTTDGETWRRQRKLSQPAFARSRLAEYTEVMSAEAVRALASWSDGETREVDRDMMTLTLRVVSKALFGHDLANADVAVVDRLMSVFQTGAIAANLLPRWLPNPARHRLRGASAALDELMYRLIARSQEGLRGGATGAVGTKANLLDMLVNAVDEEDPRARLDAREVRDNLMTLLLAGHETTSNALTWTLYALSQHPEIERTLMAEVDAVLGGRAPTFEDLPKLRYAEQVLKESMRMYPPVHSLARVAAEDSELGGYPIKKGSEVVIWVYWMHHDARWFPEPERFRPERFSPEGEAALEKSSYIPFGAGPRACIGKAFAMLEAQLLLVLLVQRFHFSLAPGQKVALNPRITLRPKHGMRMRLTRRLQQG